MRIFKHLFLLVTFALSTLLTSMAAAPPPDEKKTETLLLFELDQKSDVSGPRPTKCLKGYSGKTSVKLEKSAKTGKGAGITALITGIVAMISYLPGFAFVSSILAIVFGSVGYSRMKKTGSKGKGLSLTGLILGIVASAVYLIILL